MQASSLWKFTKVLRSGMRPRLAPALLVLGMVTLPLEVRAQDPTAPPAAEAPAPEAEAPTDAPAADAAAADAPPEASPAPATSPAGEPVPEQPPAEPPPVAPAYESSAYQSPPPASEPPAFEDAEMAAPDDDAADQSAGPFSKGSIGLSVLFGSAYFADKDYFIFGAGVSYFLVNGLSLGLDGSIWLFDDPTMGTLTPNARFVLYMVPVIKPYVGAFWRRYLIGNDIDDLSSAGGRVGAYLMPRGRSYLGLGAIYEYFIDCNEAILECDGWYPELTIGFSF